ncbi:MAG TPA: hypothetical protein VKA60_16470 [Blastocatellia bacterium]|nr:hypothetical protein [Blastocatellia bacterium]
MIQQRSAIVMLTTAAIVIGLMSAAMGRQVGVKAPPPVNAPPKKNAPPSKPIKKPTETRPVPKTAKSKIDATYPVLSRIETYKAPPDRIPHLETYAGFSTPDMLVSDIWRRVRIDLNLKLSPKAVSEETINRAMNIYLTRNWGDIDGYRPWTHWNFIRGLKVAEREALAKEIKEYIAKNGVRNVQ